MKKFDNVILTDCDGVLLNWEYAFYTWMEEQGYEPKGDPESYDMGDRYGFNDETKRHLVRMFNQSASIGYLPPLRDAMYYVDLLHRKHGYVFHVITSLSLNAAAQKLRTRNLRKLFGESVFEKFVYLDTGADKDDALAVYEGTQYTWIEDKYENAQCGLKFGLDSILIEHGHNMHVTDVPLMKNWKDVYEYLTH